MGTNVHGSSTFSSRVEILDEHVHNVGKIAPDLADSLTVTGDVAAWTLGAATEIINGGSATTVSDDFDLHFVSINGASANDEYQLNFYDDGVAIGAVVFEKTATVDPAFDLPIITPICKGGSTITAKLATKGGGSDTVRIKVKYHTY